MPRRLEQHDVGGNLANTKPEEVVFRRDREKLKKQKGNDNTKNK
jgi:hypothetical protein